MFTIYFVETTSTESGLNVSEVREKKIPASDIEDAIIMARKMLVSIDGKVFYILRMKDEKSTADFFHHLPQQIKEVYKQFFRNEEAKSEASQP